jgi:IS30 family transposase
VAVISAYRENSQANIPDALGVDQSTISREIRRNSRAHGYRFKQAHQKVSYRRSKASSSKGKFTQEMIHQSEYFLTQKQWSPEQISGWMKRTYQDDSISHEGI